MRLDRRGDSRCLPIVASSISDRVRSTFGTSTFLPSAIRCRTCREGDTGVCLNVNPERAGGAYGYVDMGGWIGGQAEYVMVPYADFNCLKFPDKAQALEKIRDLTCLTAIRRRGFDRAVVDKG